MTTLHGNKAEHIFPGQRVILLLLFCLCFWPVNAQRLIPYTWEDYVTRISEEVDEGDSDEWLTELTELHEHPLDLNNALPEELLRVPTLTEGAVEQIHAYIYLHGAIQSMGELRLVPGLTEEMMRVLPLFVRFTPKTSARQSSYKPKWEGNADYRTDVPMYYRKGYCVSPGYVGDPLYHRFRAELKKGDFRTGFRMEKDPGERYYDSYGGFVELREKGVLQQAIVGDYRAGFGQGLVLGSSSQWGISSHIVPSSQGIRPMKGMDEYRFLRGASAELRFHTPEYGDFSFTPFVSWRRLDATLNEDGSVATLHRDGLHRTQSEREGKHAVGFFGLGGHFGWKYRWLSLGLTGLWQQSSRTLQPGNALYRQIYPRGSRFGNMGLDYSCSWYRLQVSGEVAYSTERGGWATMHRIRATLRRLQLSLLPRFYSYRYHSLLASAPISSGSTPQNESGITLHLSAQLMEGLSLTAYADAAHHPWPRYGIPRADDQYRAQAEVELRPSSSHRFLATYRWRHGLERGDVLRTHHQARLQWEWQPAERHSLRTSLLTHHVERRTGWGTAVRWKFHTPKERWSGTAGLAYFDTKDYLRRIWIYEPSLMGAISNGTFSGRGIRGVTMLRWISRCTRWLLEAKLGSTYRLDTAVQSSGLQTILGRWKTDIGGLVRYSF